MNFVILALVMFGMSFLSSCKQAAKKVVEVSTSAILREVYVEIKEGADLGEIVIGSPNKKITFEVTNYSSESIRKMELVIDNTQSSLKFMPNQDDLIVTPGGGGTCGSSLKSGEKCIYVLNFVAKKAAILNIPLTFKYENFIKPEMKILYIKAVTGEVANLILTSNSSKFNFGVLEQTETTENTQTIEIQNTGDLMAREINYKLINSDEDHRPFTISENNCPSSLNSKQKCTISISYRTLGSSDSEPEKIFTAELPITYKKDQEGSLDSLSASFTFTANTIEAKLDTSFSSIEFDKIVVGNKQSRIFKISNNGYKSGYIKKLFFKKNGTSDIYATCIKGSDKMLDCTTKSYAQCLVDKKQNPNSTCSQTLKDFPFKIEDTDNCLNPLNSNLREIVGIKPGQEGGSCLFSLTYWPSITYTDSSLAENNFNNSTLSVEFDSQWKNLETIRTKDNLFKINARFKTKAKIIFESVKFGENEINPSLDAGSFYKVDLGNIAKIRNDAITAGVTKVEIIFKNVGEEKIDLQQIIDGAAPPHLITDTATDMNLYYRSIQHESLCTQLLPDATCKIIFDLTPIDVSNLADKDSSHYMYDNTANSNAKYKTFKIQYKDGSTIYDDNSEAQNSISEIRLYSNLVEKGILVFTNNSPIDFGTIVSGATSIKQKIILQNIGVGAVKAIIKAPGSQSWVERPVASVNDLKDPTFATLYNQWPFKAVSANPADLVEGEIFDCLNLIYDSPPNPTSSPDSNKSLGSGKTCILNIEAKGSDLYRENSYTSEFLRVFNKNINNTDELWERKFYNFSTIQTDKTCKLLNKCVIYGLNFEYYDGDLLGLDSSNKVGHKKQIFPIPSNENDLKKYSNDKFMNLKVNIQKPPYLVFLNPQPIHSALIVRPELKYPSLAKLTEQTIYTTSFTNGDTSAIKTREPIFARASTSQAYVNTIDEIAKTNENSIYYFGTIKQDNTVNGVTVYGFIDLKNIGDVPASDFQIAIDSGGSTAIKTPTAIMNTVNQSLVKNAVATLKFEITPNEATIGLIKKCLTITYKNQITSESTWDQRFCVYANIVADTSPSISVMAATSGGMAISQTLKSNLNYPSKSLDLTDEADTESTFFTAYYNGAGISKDFTINNTSQSQVRNLRFYLVDKTKQIINPINAVNEITQYQSVSSIGIETPCIYGNSNLFEDKFTTLNVGQQCSFRITYKPQSTENTSIENKEGYLVIVYDSVTSNDNKSLQQNMEYISLKFRPQRLDALSIASVNGTKTDVTRINPFPISPSTTGTNPWTISKLDLDNSTDRDSSPIPIGNYLKGATNRYKIGNQSGITISDVIVKNESLHYAKLIPTGCTSDTLSTCTINYDTDGFAIIKETNEITIKGNSTCFAGTGFNKNTEKCKLKINFKGKITYQLPPEITKCVDTVTTNNIVDYYKVLPSVGGKIQDSCNPFLYTISYKMEDTVNQFNLHISGFIEPEQAISDSQISSITSINSNNKGIITFKAPAYTTFSSPSLNSSSDVKYRIFYSTNLSVLLSDAIFANPTLSDTEFNKKNATLPLYTLTSANNVGINGANSFSIGNLTPKNIYYFRLALVKKTKVNNQNLSYISTVNSPILRIPTPDTNQYYSDDIKKLIDINDLAAMALNQPEAVAKCKADTSAYSAGVKRKLINSSDWKNILNVYPEKNTCTVNNSSTCYLAHWLNDNAINFSDLNSGDINISDYQNNAYILGEVFGDGSSGLNPDPDIRIKRDTNSDTSLLYKVVGYKSGLSPSMGSLYINRTLNSGLKVRCATDLADVPCPITRTPAATSILDPKCTLDE